MFFEACIINVFEVTWTPLEWKSKMLEQYLLNLTNCKYKYYTMGDYIVGSHGIWVRIQAYFSWINTESQKKRYIEDI